MDEPLDRLEMFVAERWREGAFSLADFEELALRLAEAAEPQSRKLKLARLALRFRCGGLIGLLWGFGALLNEADDAVSEAALWVLKTSRQDRRLRDVAENVAGLVKPAARAIGVAQTFAVVREWLDLANAATPRPREV